MSPIKLDMSTFQPLPKAGNGAGAVKLDMSTFQPIQRPGAGAANLGMPEDVSTGSEGSEPVERLMSPRSQEQATSGGLMAGAVGAVAIPAAAMVIALFALSMSPRCSAKFTNALMDGQTPPQRSSLSGQSQNWMT